MADNIPAGMIPAEQLAKKKDISTEEMIGLIEDGLYVGKQVNGQWYVDPNAAPDPYSRSQGVVVTNRYGTATAIARFISFVGWAFVVIGIITFGYLISQHHYFSYRILATTLPFLGISVTGLFMVAAGQMMRATLDTANNTNFIVQNMKR